ncbi:MAG: VanW family protein [Clostridia bacterium]
MKILFVILAVVFLSCCGTKNNNISAGVDEKTDVPYTPNGTNSVAEPQAAEEEYIENEVTLAQASTPLLDQSARRVENINIACGAINGMALYPGGTFSFNTAVGRRTEENGYGDASVIIDGHSEQGCGGGVCQVSSTLYMAALSAGLQIDERHPHSHGVPYAEDGNDATVVYGEKDLVFTNNTDGIITLFTWTDGNKVFSKIIKKTLDKSA